MQKSRTKIRSGLVVRVTCCYCLLFCLYDVAVYSETLAWKINQPKPVFTAEKEEEGGEDEG